MEFTRESVVVATTNMVAADMGKEVIILHLQKGHYFGLDQVGARIWDLLQSPITVNEIERQLVEEYDVEADQCHREVTGLLKDLWDEGLVEVREE